MEKITSFTIDHIKLQPGVYVSRKDNVGESTITTFDLRMTSPNEEPVMNTAEVHTIEHLAATFLRNHKEYGSKTIYFGPMGCRTGFYLLLAGDYESKIHCSLIFLYRIFNIGEPHSMIFFILFIRCRKILPRPPHKFSVKTVFHFQHKKISFLHR